MQTTVLFPGQGSQYKGMGQGLFLKYPKETQLASKLLGYDIELLCVKDPGKQLAKTEYAQPALYMVNYMQYQEMGVTPHFAAGHSLGEYNALQAAGVFDFETGMRLVQKRGELMGAATPGGMAAVLGLDIDVLKDKLQEGGYYDLDIANYNTPTQTVLSGPQASIKRICKDFGAQKIRIIPLFVTSSFHSRYMADASKEFYPFLEDVNFQQTRFPVIANTTARPYGKGEVAEMLSRQIANRVNWTDSIRYLMGQGVTNYKEVGKDILTKMVNEIRKDCSPLENDLRTPSSSNENSDESTLVESTSSSSINFETTKHIDGSEEKSVSNTDTGEVTDGIFVSHIEGISSDNIALRGRNLGSAAFREDYGVDYSYIAGAMYRGIASKELVIAMGKAGMLSFLGTGGMSLGQISEDIDAIRSALNEKQAYGMNLLNNLSDLDMEMETVELYLRKGVENVEAAAFMMITEPLVYFHVSGIRQDSNNVYRNHHRIIAKVSRPEVAEVFMSPVPEHILKRLLDKGKISQEQAEVARQLPLSHDICVEADSGGHTDGGVALVLLPSIMRLQAELQKKYNYNKKIRVGLAGGIGTPVSAASAFVMGADFILTGSINQCTVEAGTSDAVKDLLATINVQDTCYAPAGDMFELGARVQVLKKGVLFPARANKLYQLYNQYTSLEEIPEKTLAQLERDYFKKTVAEVWEDTKAYFEEIGKTAEITKAQQTPRKKMALVFRWYFSNCSKLAFAGDFENKVNFQVHTGPSLGAFNQWVKGTKMDSWRYRHVDQIGKKLMEDTSVLLENTLEGFRSSQVTEI